MKNFDILNVKKSHFVDGWANFDAVDYYHLSESCGEGCNLQLEPNTSKITVMLYEHPELMCFGKVSENGEIVLQGITGFPNDNVCVKYLRDISETAKKRKITSNYAYIEF